MKFSDIITLAKAGYSPADVKSLLELCETDPETKKKEIPEDVKKEVEKKEEKKESNVDAFAKLVENETEEK